MKVIVQRSKKSKVTIDGKCCLLLPPDQTSNVDLPSGTVTDYLKYIARGFVLLTKTGYYYNGWKGTYDSYGIYRVQQNNSVLRFAPTVNPGRASNIVTKTSALTRVRHVHTIYTP